MIFSEMVVQRETDIFKNLNLKESKKEYLQKSHTAVYHNDGACCKNKEWVSAYHNAYPNKVSQSP